MGKPSAPTPPNPTATAAAQTGTNVSTGVANAYLNNVNQITPQGSLNYEVTGNYDWTDPSTGQSYSIPRFTSTQTLSPSGQAQQVQNDATKLNLATMGAQQSQRLGDVLGQPFDPLRSAPAAGMSRYITDGLPQASMTFDKGHDLQFEFGDAGPMTKSYGAGDFSADRRHVEEALMARMNPQLNQDEGRLRQQLADQGIRYGSEAYNNAYTPFNQRTTDARFAAVSQAGQEQQRMMDMAAKRAGFENSAQQQNYEQLMGRATFNNQTVGQEFNQNLQRAQFGNTGLAQRLNQAQAGFNARNAERNQYLQEQYAVRNQPLNEISALMSGGAVQAPNWLNSPSSQIATTDFAGIMNQNFAQQQQNYQTQNQNWQQLAGGILGLGAGAMRLSDEREKEGIEKLGTVFAFDEGAERKKLPIYEYQYKQDPSGTRHIGPMAQEVEKLDRGAVHNVRGRKMIDTGRVMGNILRAA
jgi:hypothetical protein